MVVGQNGLQAEVIFVHGSSLLQDDAHRKSQHEVLDVTRSVHLGSEGCLTEIPEISAGLKYPGGSTSFALKFFRSDYTSCLYLE